MTVNGMFAQNLTGSGSGCPAIIPIGTTKFGGTGFGTMGLASLTYTLTNTGGFVRPQMAATGF